MSLGGSPKMLRPSSRGHGVRREVACRDPVISEV